MSNKHIPEHQKIAEIIAENFDPQTELKYNASDFEWAALQVENAGYRKQEWISVEERLPERQGAYLIFTCDRRISMCHFIDHYCDGNMQFDDYRVTHWMPLPLPPKMKGDEGE